MPLISRNKLPPGGFPYREVAVNWKEPNPLLPFNMIAADIQSVRMQNPHAGLNPSLEACADALDAYTCARLKNDLAWCQPNASQVAKVAAEARKPKPCAGCGKKKQ